MRIEATFDLPGTIRLPYDLNYPLMSWIYRCLSQADPALGSFIHSEGLRLRGRSYKPFVFSLPRFTRRHNLPGEMEVSGRLSLKIGSIRTDVIRSIHAGIRKQGALKLREHVFPLVNLRVEEPVRFTERMAYRPLSPIVVPVSVNGKVRFCHPLESDFYDSLRLSVRNWYHLRWNEPLPPDVPVRIRLMQPERFSLERAAVLLTVKEKKIKGYQVPLEVEAPPRVQQVIHDSGLGSYGSQGFGMVDVWRDPGEKRSPK
ncbi:CRISPR-associated endoribonuclease Cas6 [Staphylospora marina]|uniref:CRISPR-associated endoribonuclease Cas6 n=1 Tax=Staphylospora marina TaxID=2490858 RepID=UPI000F5BBC92|nr:CRISPR-associated endoribonuclease Cas6 [Staphylospora marina]